MITNTSLHKIPQPPLITKPLITKLKRMWKLFTARGHFLKAFCSLRGILKSSVYPLFRFNGTRIIRILLYVHYKYAKKILNRYFATPQLNLSVLYIVALKPRRFQQLRQLFWRKRNKNFIFTFWQNEVIDFLTCLIFQ